ncbi:hypothetical protein LP419_17850 [Massilia sp. H-1]|nr:hypothetical protein LP419_17850 [Massilia sp. H-1]
MRSVIPEDPQGTELRGYGTSQFAQYRADTLDLARFPQPRLPARGAHGARAGRQRRRRGRGPLDPDRDGGDQRRQLGLSHVYGEYAHSNNGYSPLSLGGFLRLSGTVPDSIQGKTVAFGRLVLARRIGALPVTLGGTVRAGFSLEVGGGFDLSQPSVGASVKQAVSGFLSVDTRFGPAYVGGWQATKEGNSTLYLFLGPVW